MEEAPKAIVIEGKEYPVVSVERGPRGDIRTMTLKGVVDFENRVPVYPYRIEEKP